MIPSDILQKLRAELEKRSIYDLRQIGRAVGVKRPADMNKAPLIDSIMEIAECKAEPAPRARGESGTAIRGEFAAPRDRTDGARPERRKDGGRPRRTP